MRDAFGHDGSVRAACERHEVGSGQLYTWRRQAISGELIGQIGIELPSGVRLTVDAMVDAEALARVIGVLAR